MIDKERAKKLLGSGVQAEIVAATLGCEPSYISQLLSDDHFREEVIALRMATLTHQISRIKIRIIQRGFASDQSSRLAPPRR